MGYNLAQIPMKKRNLFAMMFCSGVFATALLLSSCGSGEGEGENNVKIEKFPKNEILGNMVNIVNEHFVLDSTNKAQIKELKANVDVKKKDKKEYEKYKEKYIEFKGKKEKLEADFQSAVESEKVNLIGKSIPFEMEDDLGYEVTECKIVDVNKRGGFMISVTAKLTDPDKAPLVGSSPVNLYCHFQYIDKDGNNIKIKDKNIGNVFEVSLPDKNAGTVGTATSLEDIGRHGGRCAKCFANLSKVRFVKTNKK